MADEDKINFADQQNLFYPIEFYRPELKEIEFNDSANPIIVEEELHIAVPVMHPFYGPYIFRFDGIVQKEINPYEEILPLDNYINSMKCICYPNKNLMTTNNINEIANILYFRIKQHSDYLKIINELKPFITLTNYDIIKELLLITDKNNCHGLYIKIFYVKYICTKIIFGKLLKKIILIRRITKSLAKSRIKLSQHIVLDFMEFNIKIPLFY